MKTDNGGTNGSSDRSDARSQDDSRRGHLHIVPSTPDDSPPSPYLLPVTASEVDRMQQQHWLFHAITGHDVLAVPFDTLPLGAPILDIGCGHGIAQPYAPGDPLVAAPPWLRSVLAQRPDLDATGIDLHARELSITLTGLPPEVSSTSTDLPDHAPADAGDANAPVQLRAPARGGMLHLIAADVLKGLPFANESFDYVHQRQLCAALPTGEWQAVVNEAVRVTRPGGWIEFVEGGPVHSIPIACPAVRELDRLTTVYGRTRDIDLTMTGRLPDLLRASGRIVPSSLRYYSFPIVLGEKADPWGSRAAANWLGVRRAMAPQLLQGGVISDMAQYEDYLAQAYSELRTATVPWPVYVAYAQRQ